MTTQQIPIGGAVIEHECDLKAEDRRFLRLSELLTTMTREEVLIAEEKLLVEKGTCVFLDEMNELITAINKGEKQTDDVLEVMLVKAEDAFIVSRPIFQMTEDQKLKVVEMCKRDGHNEMAEEIQNDIDKEKK